MIKITTDGSATVYSDCFKQYYHSIFGAHQESERVYMELALHYAFENFDQIKIFEFGFGTGLNALLASQRAENKKINVQYTGLEAYPIDTATAQALNYDVLPFHQIPWNQFHSIHKYFHFRKIQQRIEDFETNEKFNVVFYDAFAPSSQPELWQPDVFLKIAGFLEPGSVLTTYCSKVLVQKSLKSAGFRIEKLSGPYRKREVIRAILN